MLTEREIQVHMHQTQLLTHQRNYDGALREDQKVLSVSPKSPLSSAALYSMGLIFADHANPDKDYRKALGFFTQLLSDFPHSPFAEESRVWIGVLKNEVSVEREGRNHLQRMQLLIRKGDFESALQENKNVLSVSPKSPLSDAALYSMGLIFADRANPDKDDKKALGFFSQMVKEFPQSSFADESRVWIGVLGGRAHLQRMQLLIRNGDFEGALKENQQVLSVSPRSPLSDAALYSMGLIFADHANPDKDGKKALGFFSQLVKDFPQSSFADESRVWIGILNDEVSQEREGYAYLQRMQALIRKGHFDSALRENQRILSGSPKSPLSDEALYSMGLIYAHYANQKKDYKTALNYFLRLKKEFPDSYLLEEARIWVGVLETLENSLRIDIKVDEKKKELRR